jgi:hypothetical protein
LKKKKDDIPLNFKPMKDFIQKKKKYQPRTYRGQIEKPKEI